jgi:hypothetical protein
MKISGLHFMLLIVFVSDSWAQLPGSLANGLVGYYELNGNANDSSSNQVNGVAVGGLSPTTDRFGNVAGALAFNGIDQTIAAPDQNFPRATENFSISLWVNPTGLEPLGSESVGGTSYSHAYAIGGVQGGNDSGISLAVGTNGVAILEHGDRFLPVVLSYAVSITDWTMVTITVSNNGAPNLYINGSLVRTGLSSGRVKIASVFAGDDYQGIGGGGYGRYAGAIDDLLLYNRALSSNEVTDLYNAQRVEYEVTLTLKSSTNMKDWTPVLTNVVETYNPQEFYKKDISVRIKTP